MDVGCQKILAICQLSVKFKVFCQLSVKLLLIINYGYFYPSFIAKKAHVM